MIVPLVIATAVGWLFGRKAKPKTEFHKREVLGTKSGAHYLAEDFPTDGILVIYADDYQKTVAHFRRETLPNGPFRFALGTGDPNMLAQMKDDFDGGK
jgi:hypothetical protein